jgi:hypothetical protein
MAIDVCFSSPTREKFSNSLFQIKYQTNRKKMRSASEEYGRSLEVIISKACEVKKT